MKKIFCMFALMMPLMVNAQSADFGMWYSIGAEKYIDNKWSVEGEAEFRNRNNLKTADRFSVGVDLSYKIAKGLKASAGYSFLYDNNEEMTYYTDGSYKKWTPSYWGARHRFNVTLTGSLKLDRFKFQLRERWQYTYRPEKTTERYDCADEEWEEKVVRGKGKNVLRSRLQVSYDIRNSKVDPFASVELFNAWNVQKMRYQVGLEYKLKKQHVFELAYRYQTVTDDDDDNEADRHMIGLSYKYKF